MRISQHLIDLGKYKTIAVNNSLIALQDDAGSANQQVAKFECTDTESKVESSFLKPIPKPKSVFDLATDEKQVFIVGGWRKKRGLFKGMDSLNEV